MSAVSSLLTLTLAALAILHGYWAFGGIWPGTDEASCARTIAGFRGIERMPSMANALVVAALLATAAVLARLLGEPIGVPSAPWLLPLAGVGASVVFLGRGAAGFTSAWRRLTPEQPFASLDIRYYSPLCLAIGSGFAFLVFKEVL